MAPIVPRAAAETQLQLLVARLKALQAFPVRNASV
jgi:hypothetical protein